MLVHGVLGCFVAAVSLAGAGPAQESLPLRVLYAGDGETRRSREFVDFFAERTAGVRAARREELSRVALRDIDVVIIDGDAEVYANRFATNSPPRPPNFDLVVGVPTVLVGWVGLTTGGHWKLKTSLFLG